MGQQLLNATAERMLAGEQDLALITSAEALATQARVQETRRTSGLLLRTDRTAAVPVGVAAGPRRGRARGVPGLAHVRGVRERAPRSPRRRPRGVPAGDRRDAGADDRDRGGQSRCLVPGRPLGRRPRHGAARQPDGRLPVHQVHGVGDGRRHGGRPRRRDPRTGRCARCPGRPPRLPPRLLLRDRSRPRRGAARDVAVTGDEDRRGTRRSRPPGSASTTSATSTSTPVSAARCTSRAMPSVCRPAIPAASR